MRDVLGQDRPVLYEITTLSLQKPIYLIKAELKLHFFFFEQAGSFLQKTHAIFFLQ